MTTTLSTVDATRFVLRHQVQRTRRVWWSIVVSGLAQPTLFLLAIGAGIGSQIDDDELMMLGADSYLAWIGPGILAVSAMQVASFESMWPTMGLLQWEGTYRAVLRTPISSAQLGIAHVAWLGTRALATSTCFLIVLTIAGAATSPWAITVPFVAATIGIAHAGPIAAFTASIEHDNWFPPISRVVIFPLFIFSGAFFPVDEMPSALAVIARITPTWHGVQCVRHLASGAVDASTAGHFAVVGGCAALGVLLVHRSFGRNVDP